MSSQRGRSNAYGLDRLCGCARNPFGDVYREGHENDNETSEFGIGFKASAMNLGDRCIIYTYSNGKYYEIELDFNKMA